MLAMQQKLEESRHRATQEQYYGKRGMSFHGTALFISRRAKSEACAADHLVPDENTHPYQTYFFDDIVRNSQQQDTMAAMSLIEAAIMRVRTLFPEVATVSFQSDNGAAYAAPFLLFMIPTLTAKHGLRATEFIHSEAGDGKTVLDGHFGIQTFMMKVGQNEVYECVYARPQMSYVYTCTSVFDAHQGGVDCCHVGCTGVR